MGVSSKPWLVITTCTASKRSVPMVRANGLKKGAQVDVASAWLGLVGKQVPDQPAQQLYKGRAFGLAAAAAATVGGELGVVSAGLGFVLGRSLIPAYDITIRTKASSSVRKYIDGDFDAEAWWLSISRGPFSIDLGAELSGRPGVLVCLSQAYAEMVAKDLMVFARDGGQLRIFGLSIAKHLPRELREFVLPYDERLSQLGLTGTRVDFPQRALADYVQNIHGNATDLAAEREVVLQRMSAAPATVTRKAQLRLSDDEVKALIVQTSATLGRSRTRLLSHIRHTCGCSCEQSRFFRLCDQVFGEAA